MSREIIKTIHLERKATLGERSIDHLDIAEPETGDFLRTDGHDISDVGADVALLSALTGEPEDLIKKINIDDWAVIRVELKGIWLRYFGINPAETAADDGKKKNT